MLRKVVLALDLVLSLCFITLPFGAQAQQSGKVYRIGILWVTSPNLSGGLADAFKNELHDLGYVEGQNLIIDSRWADGKTERLADLATELVVLKPDAIVAVTTSATRAAQQATMTIPIVMTVVSDPVGSGFVATLAHPGGNVTGVSDFGFDLAAKYVELVHAVVPQATRVAVLMSDNPVHPSQLKAIQDAATNIGLAVLPTMERSPEDLDQAFASLLKQNVGALIVLGGAPQNSQMKQIAKLAEAAKLPTILPAKPFVVAGGLLSYGPAPLPMFRSAARYVGKILKGTKPGHLPVQQPTQLELVVSLKTARTLGLTIPQSLLLRPTK